MSIKFNLEKSHIDNHYDIVIGNSSYFCNKDEKIIIEIHKGILIIKKPDGSVWDKYNY